MTEVKIVRLDARCFSVSITMRDSRHVFDISPGHVPSLRSRRSDDQHL